MEFSEQAQVYRSRAIIESPPSAIDNYLNIYTVGGYSRKYKDVNNKHSGMIPALKPGGCVHLLSGNCISVLFSHRWPEPLYLHLVHFDSAFGITQIHPKQNSQRLSSLKTGTELDDHLSFDIGISLPDQIMNDKGVSATTELIKVFVTNRKASFHSLTLRSIREKDFLNANPDPLASIHIKGIDSGSFVGTYRDHFKAGEVSSYVPVVEGDRDIWYCFDLKLVLHKTAESLALV